MTDTSLPPEPDDVDETTDESTEETTDDAGTADAEEVKP